MKLIGLHKCWEIYLFLLQFILCYFLYYVYCIPYVIELDYLVKISHLNKVVIIIKTQVCIKLINWCCSREYINSEKSLQSAKLFLVCYNYSNMIVMPNLLDVHLLLLLLDASQKVQRSCSKLQVLFIWPILDLHVTFSADF